MKKTYFSHEANARNDEKCIALRMAHGLEGYGLYWCIIERLMSESDYSSVTDYNVIAFDLRCDAKLVKTVVEDFGLFTFTEDGERFYSESLMRRMLKVDEISEQNRLNAKKRWGNGGDDGANPNANAQNNDATAMRPHAKTDATALQTHANFDAKKGSKQKEEKEVNVRAADIFSDRFDLFWNSYPEKVGKGDARKAFLKLKPSQELTERMIRAVEAAKQSDKWQRGFVPNPSTWLNQERWEDEPMPPAKPKQDKSEGCFSVHPDDEKRYRKLDTSGKF